MLEGVTSLGRWEGESQCPVSDDLADTFTGAAQLSSDTVSDGNTQSPLQLSPERFKGKYKASFKIVCCQVKAGCVDIIVHDAR